MYRMMVLSSQIRFAHTEAFLNVKKCKIEHSRHNTLEIESNRMGPVESNRMGPVMSRSWEIRVICNVMHALLGLRVAALIWCFIPSWLLSASKVMIFY
jgi:hypothetical protein